MSALLVSFGHHRQKYDSQLIAHSKAKVAHTNETTYIISLGYCYSIEIFWGRDIKTYPRSTEKKGKYCIHMYRIALLIIYLSQMGHYANHYCGLNKNFCVGKSNLIMFLIQFNNCIKSNRVIRARDYLRINAKVKEFCGYINS